MKKAIYIPDIQDYISIEIGNNESLENIIENIQKYIKLKTFNFYYDKDCKSKIKNGIIKEMPFLKVPNSRIKKFDVLFEW